MPLPTPSHPHPREHTAHVVSSFVVIARSFFKCVFNCRARSEESRFTPLRASTMRAAPSAFATATLASIAHRDARFDVTTLTCDASSALKEARKVQLLILDDAFVFVVFRGFRRALARERPNDTGGRFGGRRSRVVESPFEFKGGKLDWELELAERRRRRRSGAPRDVGSSGGGGGGGAAGIESVMTIEIMFSDIVGLDHVNHLLLNSRLTLETSSSTTRTFGTLSDAVRFHGAALRRRTGALDFEYPKRWDGVSLSEEREAKRQVLGSKRARDGDDARFALGDSSSEDSEEDEVDAPTTSSAIVEPIRVNVLRGYKTFVTTFDNIELQPALQSVIEPHKRLLTLFETGLPLWAILGPQFGICLPQRPLVRKGLKVAFLALTLMSVVAGLHELQENLPGTPLAKWMPRLARVVDSEPSVKVASSIYTQSIILAPFYSAIRAASFGLFRLAMSIARGLVIPAMRVAFALLSGNSLARTFSTAFGSANGFVNVWKGAILLLARSSQGLVKLIVYIADRIFVHRKSLRLRAEELAGVTPQRSAFVSPMRSRAVETRLVSQIVDDEDEYDDIDDVDAKKND